MHEKLSLIPIIRHCKLKYQWRYPGNAKIKKHSCTKSPKDAAMRNKQWPDKCQIWNHRRTNKNCNRGSALERSVENTTGSLYKFYPRDISPFFLTQLQTTNIRSVKHKFSQIQRQKSLLSKARKEKGKRIKYLVRSYFMRYYNQSTITRNLVSNFL